uniref:Uncharacterized protein n=1 Tax=Romanomermis culicivorax TaxID=13658 RepID=A0A915IJM2_ROMCU
MQMERSNPKSTQFCINGNVILLRAGCLIQQSRAQYGRHLPVIAAHLLVFVVSGDL